MKKILSLFLCAAIVWSLAACGESKQVSRPSQESVETDVQAYITELLDQNAVITSFEEQDSIQNGENLTIICIAIYGDEENYNEGEFTLVYNMKDKAWNLSRCSVELIDDTEVVPEVEESIEAAEESEETEQEVPAVAPVYLNELPCASKIGKLWYKYDGELGFEADTRQELIDLKETGVDLWKETDTPGWTPGVVEDNMGNVYTYGLHIDGRGAKTYMMSFDLNGQYTTFSGTCACVAERCCINLKAYDTEKNLAKYFEVYGDGTLLFTSDFMRYDAAPQEFEIDVTGVDKLIIAYPPTDGPNEIATIYDGMLS